MNKDKEIFGIDISKDVFSISQGHCQFKNDATGFKLFLKTLPKEAIMFFCPFKWSMNIFEKAEKSSNLFSKPFSNYSGVIV